MKGAIIAGYQGIGKSTLAKAENDYIDLESGNFWVNGKRPKDWYTFYGNIAFNLALQGYRVFVSSHEVVRNYLICLARLNKVDLYVCFPDHSLKKDWTNKLRERYRFTKSQKDYKAWRNAVDRYDENIEEIKSSQGFTPIVITSMDYDLKKMIEEVMERREENA